MHPVTSGIIGGVIGLSVMGLFPQIDAARAVFDSAYNKTTKETVLHNVNRTSKQDRLTNLAPLPGGGAQIAMTEVLGGVSVVHRDREGRVLSRTDGVSNTTYVTKTIVPPNVNERNKTAPIMRTHEGRRIAPPRDMPEGCESAVSVTADPVLARTASRCIS